MKKTLITILALSAQVVFAQTHGQHHDHHHHSEKHQSTTSRVKDLGSKKFAPTDDLKIRMEKILGLMKELHTKNTDKNQVKAYGEKITNVVNDIFKTCKLEPDADAAIHPVLAKILGGTQDFKDGKFDKGHAKIHEAFLGYEKLFSHKGWKH